MWNPLRCRHVGLAAREHGEWPLQSCFHQKPLLFWLAKLTTADQRQPWALIGLLFGSSLSLRGISSSELEWLGGLPLISKLLLLDSNQRPAQ